MCGITGIVNLKLKSPSEAVLKKMTDAIIHRGPDDGGIEIIGKCGLGNRRLAIIDLSKNAHMPMWNLKGDFCITYNGEIYNYQKLKKDLLRKGYKFHSKSDTEVIVNLYKEYGENCVSKLRGMFALAIWDKKNEELFLARDQFGIKPLHYFLGEENFVFGSEIKSILLHPDVRININPVGLNYYFSHGFGAVSSPETIFEGIKKLEPGNYAILKKGKLKISKYWDLSEVKNQNIEFDEAIEKTRSLIEESVKDQLISDVPLGSFLSGGIDSSLITAFSQKNTRHDIKTFSIGFEDKKYDESDYALQVSKYLKTDHHHKSFNVRQLIEYLPKLIEKLDEPLADASILPTYLLSEYTKEFVTVALSGDGGDEIFAGYPTYIAHKLAQPLNLFSSEILKGMENLALKSSGLISKLPIVKHAGNLSTDYKLKRFFEGLDRDLAIQYLNFMGPMNLSEKRKLLIDMDSQSDLQSDGNDTNRDKAVNFVKEKLVKTKSWDRQKKLQYSDFLFFMGEDCLVKTDRASSFNSLEVRPPFLNVELVEFVFSLPSRYKLHGMTMKYLLKKVSEGILPDNIINRKKKGFGIPTGEWLSGELKAQAEDLLNKSRIKKQGLFDVSYVEKLKKGHFGGRQNHRMVLWNLFIFELWWDKWMRR